MCVYIHTHMYVHINCAIDALLWKYALFCAVSVFTSIFLIETGTNFRWRRLVFHYLSSSMFHMRRSFKFFTCLEKNTNDAIETIKKCHFHNKLVFLQENWRFTWIWIMWTPDSQIVHTCIMLYNNLHCLFIQL